MGETDRVAAPVRLRLSRAKGFDLQALSRATNGLTAVVVARPTRWGNPYCVRPSANQGWWDVVGGPFIPGQCSFKPISTARLFAVSIFENSTEIGKTVSVYPLRGRNLACWCPLPTEGEADCCHAAVLLRLANAPAARALQPDGDRS